MWWQVPYEQWRQVRSWGSSPVQLLFIRGICAYKLFLISTQLSSVSAGMMSDRIIKISLDSRRREALGFLLAWEMCGVFESVFFCSCFSTASWQRPSWELWVSPAPWTDGGNLARSALWNLKGMVSLAVLTVHCGHKKAKIRRNSPHPSPLNYPARKKSEHS